MFFICFFLFLIDCLVNLRAFGVWLESDTLRCFDGYSSVLNVRYYLICCSFLYHFLSQLYVFYPGVSITDRNESREREQKREKRKKIGGREIIKHHSQSGVAPENWFLNENCQSHTHIEPFWAKSRTRFYRFISFTISWLKCDPSLLTRFNSLIRFGTHILTLSGVST